MTISTKLLRQYLQDFEFKNLFIELGWNKYVSRLQPFTENGITYKFEPVAEQGGMVIITCQASDGNIPGALARQKIEKHATELIAHEHIVIFVDSTRTTSLWQWAAKQDDGKVRLLKHPYRKGQHADALLQKLAGIAFTLQELDEFDGQPTVSTVKSRVAKAFNVEEVTNDFYKKFRDEHKAFSDFLKGIDEEKDKSWYVSVMLNRLMFLYFVQKKRFLNGDADYLRTKLGEMIDTERNYFRDFLLNLFFEGLASEESDRSETTRQLIGRVPYLNGGLFLPHKIEDEHASDKNHPGDRIDIPNAAFTRLFDFFSKYNWHLDVRLQKPGNEINPDVLGFIFEKYINQKEMGAYYTKEDITGYICKNTILPFLLEKVGVDVRAVMTDIDSYIYDAVSTKDRLPTETDREYVARRARYEQIKADFAAGKITTVNDLITYNLDILEFTADWLRGLTINEALTLQHFYFECLVPLTVLDPTCGSGAFLFAAMNILEPLYDIALDKMRRFVAEDDKAVRVKFFKFDEELEHVAKHPNARYFVFKSIIINNLYGVDIMDEAVEICKLRLFLKLVAQLDEDDKARIEPLPDIDFNIRAGNTLVGFATQSEINGRLFATDALKRKVANVDRAVTNFRELQTRVGVESKLFKSSKQTIQAQLDAIRDDLDRSLMEDYGLSDLAAFRKSHEPFHWYVEFNNVITGGGFDVIVGNPPYAELRTITKYSLLGYSTIKTKNLYSLVIERCMPLSRHTGNLGFIVPVSSISSEGYMTLQKILFSVPLHISSFDDRPAKLFDGLEHIRLSIHIIHNTPTAAPKHYTTKYNRWYTTEREKLFDSLEYQQGYTNYLLGTISKIGNRFEKPVLEKLWLDYKSLEQQVDSKGRFPVYYSRKMGGFLQVLDFVPEVFDGTGKLRPPSEFKELLFATKEQANSVFCALNSNLFRWFIDVFSDCRHLNKREIDSFRFDLVKALSYSNEWKQLSTTLSSSLRKTSEYRQMKFKHDTLSWTLHPQAV